MTNKFSKIIKIQRKKISLTQSEVCEQLVDNYGNEFKSLEPTTYSRWEAGIITPKPRRQAMIFDELNIIKSITEIDIRKNVTLSEKKNKLLYKLFPINSELMYFDTREVEIIKSFDKINELSSKKLGNYLHRVNTELRYISLYPLKNHDVLSFNIEYLVLKLDRNIHNHVTCMTIPYNLIGLGTKKHSEIQCIIKEKFKSDSFLHKPVFVIQGVITDECFFYSVIKWVFDKNIKDKKVRESVIFIWSNSDLWSELYETLWAIPLIENDFFNNQTKLYAFCPYDFLSSPTILELIKNDDYS